MFRSIIQSIYFNFHYLPIKEAVKLPILLYKPTLLECKGRITIEGPIKTGMIRLGTYQVSLYPNNGFFYENHGGHIIFKGNCSIGNNSAVSIGSGAKLSVEDNFGATTSLKLACYHDIVFEKDVLCGWDCLFTDTDFHRLTLSSSSTPPDAYKSIHIGQGCWFAMKAIVLKGSCMPAECVIAANSLINKHYDIPEKSLVAGQPAILKKTGIYRDKFNDKIEYKHEF